MEATETRINIGLEIKEPSDIFRTQINDLIGSEHLIAETDDDERDKIETVVNAETNYIVAEDSINSVTEKIKESNKMGHAQTHDSVNNEVVVTSGKYIFVIRENGHKQDLIY